MYTSTRLTEINTLIESGDTGWQLRFNYAPELEDLCVALTTGFYAEYRHRGRLLWRVLEYFKAENIDGFWVEIGWNYVNIHIIAVPPRKSVVDHYKAIAAFDGWGKEKLLCVGGYGWLGHDKLPEPGKLSDVPILSHYFQSNWV